MKVCISMSEPTFAYIDDLAEWNHTSRSHIFEMLLSVGIGRLRDPGVKSQGELALECIKKEYTQPGEYVTPLVVDPRYALLLNKIEDLIDAFRGRNAETA